MHMKVFLQIIWNTIVIKLRTKLTNAYIKGIHPRCLHRDMMTLDRKQKASKQKEARYLDRNPDFLLLLHLPRQLVPSKMPAEANHHIPVNSPKCHQNRTREMSQIRKSLLVPH